MTRSGRKEGIMRAVRFGSVVLCLGVLLSAGPQAGSSGGPEGDAHPGMSGGTGGFSLYLSGLCLFVRELTPREVTPVAETAIMAAFLDDSNHSVQLVADLDDVDPASPPPEKIIELEDHRQVAVWTLEGPLELRIDGVEPSVRVDEGTFGPIAGIGVTPKVVADLGVVTKKRELSEVKPVIETKARLTLPVGTAGDPLTLAGIRDPEGREFKWPSGHSQVVSTAAVLRTDHGAARVTLKDRSKTLRLRQGRMPGITALIQNLPVTIPMEGSGSGLMDFPKYYFSARLGETLPPSERQQPRLEHGIEPPQTNGGHVDGVVCVISMAQCRPPLCPCIVCGQKPDDKVSNPGPALSE